METLFKLDASAEVIEDVAEETTWWISFGGLMNPNPELEDCFRVYDGETAFRLKKYLNDRIVPSAAKN